MSVDKTVLTDTYLALVEGYSAAVDEHYRTRGTIGRLAAGIRATRALAEGTGLELPEARVLEEPRCPLSPRKTWFLPAITAPLPAPPDQGGPR